MARKRNMKNFFKEMLAIALGLLVMTAGGLIAFLTLALLASPFILWVFIGSWGWVAFLLLPLVVTVALKGFELSSELLALEI